MCMCEGETFDQSYTVELLRSLVLSFLLYVYCLAYSIYMFWYLDIL